MSLARLLAPLALTLLVAAAAVRADERRKAERDA